MEGGVWRALLAVMLSVAVAGPTACGDDGATSAKRAETVDTIGQLPNPKLVFEDLPVRGSGDRAEVQEVVNDVQDALLTLSGWGVCNELTTRAQKAVAIHGNCITAYDRILRRPENSHRRRLRSKVLLVEAGTGGQAGVAVVETPGRPEARVPLVNEDGRWKLPRIALDDSTGLATR